MKDLFHIVVIPSFWALVVVGLAAISNYFILEGAYLQTLLP